MVVGKRVTLFKKKPLEKTLHCFSSIVCVRSQKSNTIHSQGSELPHGMNRKESWWKGAHLSGCLPLALCGSIEGIPYPYHSAIWALLTAYPLGKCG